MISAETILNGYSAICKDCGVRPVIRILQCAAGFYFGTKWRCGPYTRESHYYQELRDAEDALEEDEINWRQ